MKKNAIRLWAALILVLYPTFSLATPGDRVPTGEMFTGSVLAEGLDAPWEMLWGPDNMLWVTERMGSRITRVDPATGEKKTLHSLSGVFIGPQHEGILGMAFSPSMTAEKGHVFVAYTYKDVNGKELERVSRFDYDGSKQTLGNETIIIEGIPAGDDHQGGRLVFGSDGTLYLSKGELGHNQFGNYCKPIEAQRLPTAEEVKDKNYAGYLGKILRMNADGSIPMDNPELNGVVSHVYSYGHRNPQGLVFARGVLYSSEQGPSTDDEINIIVSGGNYGWPHVAGFQDDNGYRYANYSAAPNCQDLKYDANDIPSGVPVHKESDWKTPDNFQPPVMTFYTIRDGYDFTDTRCADHPNMCWPTVSPGSIAYYPENGAIPGWRNSLLITSMKNGVVYRAPLSDSAKQPQGFVATHFYTPNRYRVSRVSPDGKTVYIATDKSGTVIGQDGKPTDKLANPGAILKFEYKGN